MSGFRYNVSPILEQTLILLGQVEISLPGAEAAARDTVVEGECGSLWGGLCSTGAGAIAGVLARAVTHKITKISVNA